MKTIKLILLLLPLFYAGRSDAQSAEIEQLLLNSEKLTQLKNILSDMKRGYTSLANGYNAVKNVAEGQFNLREAFMTGLRVVSPEVRKYSKVIQIIDNQATLIAEYKRAISRFRAGGSFKPSDIDYLESVYSGLTKSSVRNLEKLLSIITTSKLEMSDSERLAAIDELFDESTGSLSFLRRFNNEVSIFSAQRKYELEQISTTKNLFP